MKRHWFHGIFVCAVLAIAAPAWGQSATEKATAQRIATTIKESKQLSNYRLGVKYQDGVAWLLGTVSSEEQLGKAIRLTEQVEGVEQVICKLQVEGMGPTVELSSSRQETDQPLPADIASPAVTKASATPAATNQLRLAKLEKLPTMEELVEVDPTPAAQPQRSVGRAQRSAQRSNMPQPMHRVAQARMAAARQQAMPAAYHGSMAQPGMGPRPAAYHPGGSAGVGYDNAHLPGYAWPSYAAYPNYAALTYPKQYSPAAWPYIGPFYPYPQVPLGWRKVTLEWDDGWWNLDFSHCKLQ